MTASMSPSDSAGRDRFARYREANRERVRERDARYREANRERLREHDASYREANRAALREYARQHRLTNRQACLDRDARYRKTASGRASVALRHYVYRSPRGWEGVVERFDPFEVFERDNWTCCVCHEQLDREAAARSSKAPTLEHLITIADGGEHSRANTAAAHYGCNSRRQGRSS